eukprot:m.379780 g.379780  ORF g.379780 m.379780 type:complete len:61 (-) comp100228_c0_seq1:66-248(-)
MVEEHHCMHLSLSCSARSLFLVDHFKLLCTCCFFSSPFLTLSLFPFVSHSLTVSLALSPL